MYLLLWIQKKQIFFFKYFLSNIFSDITMFNWLYIIDFIVPFYCTFALINYYYYCIITIYLYPILSLIERNLNYSYLLHIRPRLIFIKNSHFKSHLEHFIKFLHLKATFNEAQIILIFIFNFVTESSSKFLHKLS